MSFNLYYEYNLIMNIFTLLSYLNKISLIAFFITAGFLFYQLYLLKKGTKTKQDKPHIPDFNENMTVDISNFTKLSDTLKNEPVFEKKENKNYLFILGGLGLITIVLFIFITFRSASTPMPQVSVQITLTPTPTLRARQLLSPSPVASEQAMLSPTLEPTKPVVTPTIEPSENPTPTEIILAKISPSPTVEYQSETTVTVTPTTITSLPTTGIIDRGLAIFAVASLLIFFSFVF